MLNRDTAPVMQRSDMAPVMLGSATAPVMLRSATAPVMLGSATAPVMLRSDAKHRVSKHHQNGAREACNIGPRPFETRPAGALQGDGVRRALRALLTVTV